jgi:membrane carboxypeptidase/penicillin-binding protein PbpC
MERAPLAILKVTNSHGEVLESAADSPGRQTLGEHGEQIAYLLTDILSDNQAREYMFGPNNVMELSDGRPAAVKTGTSNDWRDSWAVGFTPDVTVGVWVGNSDGSPMQEVAGSNGAGTIWREIMDTYHDGRPIQGFKPPPGITTARICADTGALAGDACPHPMDEHFIAGTEPKSADVFFKTVKVGGDGNCLAAPYTPAGDARDRVFTVYPAEFHDWAVGAGIAQPPTDYCPPPQNRPDASIARIAFPSAGATITSTSVLVRGTARGEYVLEWGGGADPSAWQTIAQGSSGVSDGILGVWPTADLPPGQYTLRLRVTTTDRLTAEARATITITRLSG